MGKNDTVTIENARLIFRNFAGKEGQYNREGDRSFGVLLDDDIASLMAQDGWNVKWLKAREEGEKEQAYLSVSVNFGYRPPKIVLITTKGKTFLDEEMVETLDWADIAVADMIVRPYYWDVNGKTGVKAYLHALYVTINEDELELKYADLEDAQ
jgi:hypothetical protein